MTLLFALTIYSGEFHELKQRMHEAAQRLDQELEKDTPFLSKECLSALKRMKKK
jgi:hypothetical protein